MIGRKINGRYQVLSELGDGGMAIVYKAKDLILDRLVAVKVLRNEFSRDEDFIKRFHREAESVASLSHPNIVSIYDIGEEEDCYYIVMEYVKGTTLKSLIKHYAPLPFDESVYILKQIFSAIHHAHQNGIVHRDIKPHNILIDEEDHIKVTDFGIAVAMTSATITYTNSIMGSAHYLSPEQARGGKATFKSDIYSLGIVMFEMFTGELPYAGNSPVTVALKHLNEKMPRPTDINPAIPQSLENIVLKSLAKNPQYRYAEVNDIYDDISTALDPERLGEERIVIPEDEVEDDQATKVIPKQSPLSDNTQPSEEKPKKKSKSTKVIWISIVLLFMLAGAAVAAFTIIPKIFYVPNVTVPNEVNKNFDMAYEDLRSKNLKVDRRSVYDANAAKGTVARQDPMPKTVIKENSQVTLYVSNGPPKEPVKNYIGYQKSTVQDLLQGSQYKSIKFEGEASDTAQEGEIIKQSPKPGSKVVPQNTVLDFTVSTGPTNVEVPDVTSKSKEEAQAIFDDAGLKVVFKDEFSDVVQKGTVIRQDPPPLKKISKGSTVTVWLSKGPDKKAVVDHISISVPYQDNSGGNGKPEHVKIVYTDSKHKQETTFIEQDITQTTNYVLPVTIDPGENAHYQVLVDDEVIFENTVNYNDAKQAGAD